MNSESPVIKKYVAVLVANVSDYYPGMIDDRIQQYLASVGDDIAFAALVELENAYLNKVPIRNSNQFLVGICKKVLQKGIRTPRQPNSTGSREHHMGQTPQAPAPSHSYAHGHGHGHQPRDEGQGTPYPLGPAGTGPRDAPAVLPPELAVDRPNAELEYTPEMPTVSVLRSLGLFVSLCLFLSTVDVFVCVADGRRRAESCCA